MKNKIVITYKEDGKEKTLTTFKDLKAEAVKLLTLKNAPIVSIRGAA